MKERDKEKKDTFSGIWLDTAQQGKRYQSKIKLAGTIIVTALLLYLVFRYLLPLVLPFIFAFLIAKLIYPIAKFFHQKAHFPKSISTTIAVLLFVVLVGGGVYYLFYTLCQQFVELLRNIPIYEQKFCCQLEDIYCACDKLFRWTDGTMRGFIDTNRIEIRSMIQNDIMPVLTKQTFQVVLRMFCFFGTLGIVLILTCMIVNNMEGLGKSYRKCTFYEELHMLGSPLSGAGLAYVRAQGIIIGIITLICTGGLLFINNKYSLLIGLGIAIFDAFPILGSGLILVPWAVVCLLSKDVFGAAVLITMYFLCQLIRQCLEPKLIGNRIGIKPIYTVLSIYIGIKLFGVLGVFLGPIGVVIIMTILDKVKAEMKFFLDT